MRLPIQAGTFHLAGAYSDSGTASAVFTLAPLGDGRARLEGDHTLQGTLGTLDGPSQGAVSVASARAGLDSARVVEAVQVGEDAR